MLHDLYVLFLFCSISWPVLVILSELIKRCSHRFIVTVFILDTSFFFFNNKLHQLWEKLYKMIHAPLRESSRGFCMHFIAACFFLFLVTILWILHTDLSFHFETQLCRTVPQVPHVPAYSWYVKSRQVSPLPYKLKVIDTNSDLEFAVAVSLRFYAFYFCPLKQYDMNYDNCTFPSKNTGSAHSNSTAWCL